MLTFNELREKNLARISAFRNNKGELVLDHESWSLCDWCTATAGELGEAANLIKKIRRGDFSLDEIRPALADELADVVIYLDILANCAGIDLGKATRNKWNKTAEKIGYEGRL